MESSFLDDRRDVSVKGAAAGNSTLHGVQALLPLEYSLVRRSAVFDEPEDPSRTQHPADFAYGGDGIGDAAQRPRGKRRIDGIVIEWQRLPVQSDEFHRDCACRDALGREDSAAFERVDGPRDLDPGRQVGRFSPVPKPISMTSPHSAAHTRERMSRFCLVFITRFMIGGKTRSA